MTLKELYTKALHCNKNSEVKDTPKLLLHELAAYATVDHKYASNIPEHTYSNLMCSAH